MKTLQWSRRGPRHRRHYEFYDAANVTEPAPEIVTSFLQLFRSEAFFDFLHRITQIKLQTCRTELQKWTSGSYDLLDEELPANQLDVIVYFGFTELKPATYLGAQTSFLTFDDVVQTPVCNLGPVNRSVINFVYRDTARYTSYMSKYNGDRHFYALTATYFE